MIKEEILIGRFYFKKTENGNLIGEYSHNTSKSITTECAIPLGATDGFLGCYNSIWLNKESSTFSKLSIKVSSRSCKILELKWEYDETENFWGEGFIIDGMLIGDYRNFEIEEITKKGV